jgi:hypothetical protein
MNFGVIASWSPPARGPHSDQERPSGTRAYTAAVSALECPSRTAARADVFGRAALGLSPPQTTARLHPMIDAYAKTYLHDDLRWIRVATLSKLDGLFDYDIRRPLSSTGTNLLGLIKHLSIWEARYFGEVFDRPFPEPLPRWDDDSERGTDMWATEHETRAEIVDRYRRVWNHSSFAVMPLGLPRPGGWSGFLPGSVVRAERAEIWWR